MKSGAGDITVDHARRNVEITTATGDVRLRELDASAVVKNSNGDTWIGVAGGDLRVNAANGPIVVDLARGTTVAKSANGDVRLREVVRGSVVLETAMGDLEVGVGEGTAAYLDVSAAAGHVHNDLDASSDPGASAPEGRDPRPHDHGRHRDPAAAMTAAIHVRGLRSSYGDHVVLDGVDLDVEAGTIFALLGPNGAGKTTMVGILSTLIRADGGIARVAGHDVVQRPGGRTHSDRRDRPVRCGRRPADRRGEPRPDGRSAPTRPRRGAPPYGGAAGALRADRRTTQAGCDVLRRHAATPGHRDDAVGVT